MQVQVISSVNEASATQFTHKTVIVIDVLRATSTIVTALAAGAAGIIPVETVLEAKAAMRTGDLLGGERFCKKINGFDFGNSPGEYHSGAVKDKRIVLTTTNGTRAIHKAMRADSVLAGSMLNAAACAKAAAELRRDIVLLCAGTHDQFSTEDGLCAGLLISRLEACCASPLETNDLGTAMASFYRDRADSLLATMLSGTTGRRLVKLGMKRDVEICSAVDVHDAVPRLKGEMLAL